MPKYEDLVAISRAQAAEELASEDPQRVGITLVRLVLFDDDGGFLRELVSTHLRRRDPRVRGIAATCAGHLVRLHRTIDLTAMHRQLQLMRDVEDPLVRGRVGDALDDFEVFRSG